MHWIVVKRVKRGEYPGEVVKGRKKIHSLWWRVEAILSMLSDVNIACPDRNLVPCPFPGNA